MNDVFILVLAIPAAILSLIQSTETVLKYYRQYKGKDDIKDKDKSIGIKCAEERKFFQGNSKKKETLLVLLILYVALFTFFGFRQVKDRHDKITNNSEIWAIRENLKRLEEEIDFIRSENAIIMSNNLDEMILKARD